MNRLRTAAAALGCLSGFIISGNANGQTTSWSNPAGGSANTSTNWSSGVPSSSSTAQFNLPGAYAVTFDGPLVASTAEVLAGALTLDLQRQTFSLNSGINIGPNTSGAFPQGVWLTVQGGRLTATGTLDIGRFTNAAALTIRNGGAVEVSNLRPESGSVTTVSGPGSFLGFNAAQSAQTGAAFTSQLIIDNGGVVNAASTSPTLAFATATVSGTASRMRNVVVTSLRADAGAAVEYGSSFTVAGDWTVDHASLTGNGDINIGNPTIAASTARLTLRSATLTGGSSFGIFRIYGGATMQLDDALIMMPRTIANEGIVRGSARSTGGIDNALTGTVSVGNGERLSFEQRSISNANRGVMTVTGGELSFGSMLTNQASGLIVGRDATFRFGDGTTSSALALFANSSMSFIGGVNSVFGDINNQSNGRIVHAGNSETVYYDDVTNNGTIQTSAGSTALFLGAVSGPGSFTGPGTTAFEGDLRPGASPALVQFGGDVRIGSGSSLVLEIGGATRGTGYDALDVAGQLQLDGNVVFTTLYGYVPLPGQQFDFLKYGSITGTPTIDNQTGFAGLSFNGSPSANGWSITLGGTPGDANLDGRVNFDDLLALAKHYNASTDQSWLTGDFDASGTTNFDDLLALAKNYGKGTTPSADGFAADWALAQSLVPEPTVGLFAIAALACARRRNRAR